MSTNFYWIAKPAGGIELPSGHVLPPELDQADPRIHIGKRYAAGGGRCGFIWAQPSVAVLEVLRGRLDDEIVLDEYGQRYTGRAFLAELQDAATHDFGSVGVWFS